MKIKLFILLFSIISLPLLADSFTPIPLASLTSKEIGSTLIVSTTITSMVFAYPPPPDGMVTPAKEGNVYQGRLDAIGKDSITLSAFAGTPADHSFRKVIEIDKKKITEVKIDSL